MVPQEEPRASTPAAMHADARPAIRKKVRFSLGSKLALLATFLAVVPLGGVGLALIDVNRKAIVELARGTQLLALDDLARSIDQELHEAEDALDTMGALFADTSLDDETRLTVLRNMVQGQESIDHAALYDASGAQIAVIEEEGLTGVGVPETLPASVRETVEELHVATGEVTRTASGARALVAVRIRVNGRTTGYVASAVSLEDVQARVERLAAGHFHGVPDSLFVVDQELRLVAHPDRERAASRAPAGGGILEGVNADMLGPLFSRSGEYASAGGIPMLGSTVGMRGRPWALVAQVPQEIAYASLHRMQLIVGGTTVAAILLALLLGLLTARGISAPIRKLTAYADVLAARRFDERIEVRTSDELSILADTMSHAAADLKQSEEALKREVAIRTDLGRYVPEKLVDQIVRRERDMRLGGSRRTITVLFADVVGFTRIAEQLAPEHVVAILNELFTILTEIVFRHDGTVDKFVGDCVMAMWGAPAEQDDQARRAVEAAEEMLDWLETGNERWEEKYGVRVQLAIGMHTGEAVVGNIGSERRMEYTCIGHVVNLAARLEAVARPDQILVTDAVKKAAGDGFTYVDADLHRLTGFADPVHLWEVRA